MKQKKGLGYIITGLVFGLIGAALTIAGNSVGKDLSRQWDTFETGDILFHIGMILSALCLILVIVGVIAFSVNRGKQAEPKSGKAPDVNRLVVTAVLIGLGTALSLIRWQMPLGGEITLLSLVPIALISVEYGVGWGLVGSFLFSLIQIGLQLSMIMSWGLSPSIFIGSLIFDYFLAYTAIGLSGIFRKKGVVGICLGIFLALVIRFCFHIVSGTIFFADWMPEGWNNPLLYAVCYNGIFMLPEFILTTIGAVVLFKTPSFNKLVNTNLK